MAVTDLTGTKWLWNDTLGPGDVQSFGSYSVDFTSNGNSYSTMSSEFFLEDPPRGYIHYDLDTAYFNLSGGWINQAYRTIEITGGIDATNTSLIEKLQSNAEQIIDSPVLPSFSDVEVTPHEGYITMTINGVDFNLKTAASN